MRAGLTRGTVGRVVGLSALAMAIFALVACDVSSVSGPGLVTLGTDVTYTMTYTASAPDATNVTPVVYADVPAGWTVVSSSYNGTINGAPASGTGTQAATNPGACTFTSGPAPGYQRLYFTAGPFPTTLSTDSANLSITFHVGGAPGSYTLSFQGGAVTALASPCQGTWSTLPVTVGAQGIPAVSTWGAAVFAALLVLAAGLMLRRELPA